MMKHASCFRPHTTVNLSLILEKQWFFCLENSIYQIKLLGPGIIFSFFSFPPPCPLFQQSANPIEDKGLVTYVFAQFFHRSCTNWARVSCKHLVQWVICFFTKERSLKWLATSFSTNNQNLGATFIFYILPWLRAGLGPGRLERFSCARCVGGCASPEQGEFWQIPTARKSCGGGWTLVPSLGSENVPPITVKTTKRKAEV